MGVSELFELIGESSYLMFELTWVKGIIWFFQQLGWTLFVVGMFVGIIEALMEYNGGRGNFKNCMINIIRAFFAANLFTITPIALYKFSVTLQGELGKAIIKLLNASDFSLIGYIPVIISIFTRTSGIVAIFVIILVAYPTIKVFMANLQRGGILLILICVGALYMFSLPRGYVDGFTGWCKQVIALAVTATLQTTILIAGLITCSTGLDGLIIGIGLMLVADSVPKIAGRYGLDISAKGNMASMVYTANTAVSLIGKFGK